MSGILRFLYQNTYKQLIKNSLNNNSQKLNRMWYGVSGDVVTEKDITSQLEKRFPNASEISVTDVSGGCGAMFEIFVSSEEFKGLSIVKQHKAITDTLKEDIKKIHGLRIQTKVD